MKQWITVLTAEINLEKLLLDSPYVGVVVAALMSVLGMMYGNTEMVQVGMALIVLLLSIDWLAGVSGAKKDGIDTSHYGIDGLRRTMIILLLPAIGHLVGLLMGDFGDLPTYFIIGALARSITKSIIANIHRCGWDTWIPTQALETLLSWVADEIAHKEQRAKERYDAIHNPKGGE